jgi:hypothetical protein
MFFILVIHLTYRSEAEVCLVRDNRNTSSFVGVSLICRPAPCAERKTQAVRQDAPPTRPSGGNPPGPGVRRRPARRLLDPASYEISARSFYARSDVAAGANSEGQFSGAAGRQGDAET